MLARQLRVLLLACAFASPVRAEPPLVDPATCARSQPSLAEVSRCLLGFAGPLDRGVRDRMIETLPPNAAPLARALANARAQLAAVLRARRATARIEPSACVLVPGQTSASRLVFLCETRIGCASGCMDELASATVAYTTRGFRILRAGTSRRPTTGACGLCL